eukprot:maker-scaffold5_size1054832-snap-gene-0.11 protein:Tk04015 transcript:maker-scaffold5_size1054832-snap-gene-0.11-mRNA-1 annotation:"btb poz domain-containing protein 2-like"
MKEDGQSIIEAKKLFKDEEVMAQLTIIRANFQMAQPRTLDELLRDFSGAKITRETNLNHLIESKVWSHKFVEHLRRSGMSDEETMLKFLILTQPIQASYDLGGSNRKKKALPRRDIEVAAKRAVIEFFSEASEDMLSLSNNDLFQGLFECSKRLAKGQSIKEDDISLILSARTDLDVWYDGLEPTFMRFIQKAGPPSAIACLLSIL